MSVPICGGVHLLHCVRRRSYKSAGEDQRLLGGHTVATGGCPGKGESIDWNQPSDYSVNRCCQYLRGPTTTAFWI